MKSKIRIVALSAAAMSVACSCEILDNNPDKHLKDEKVYISLNEVASVLSDIPMGTAQLSEVYDAVSSSSDNGYDEEYTMKNLFISPGSGVGDSPTRDQTDYPE